MKTDTPEYMLQRVITKTVHARTLITAVNKGFIGNQEQRKKEAFSLLAECDEILYEVRADLLDKWPDCYIL